jgi:hypothetical protein
MFQLGFDIHQPFIPEIRGCVTWLSDTHQKNGRTTTIPIVPNAAHDLTKRCSAFDQNGAGLRSFHRFKASLIARDRPPITVRRRHLHECGEANRNVGWSLDSEFALEERSWNMSEIFQAGSENLR